jgi:hypothetical protein
MINYNNFDIAINEITHPPLFDIIKTDKNKIEISFDTGELSIGDNNINIHKIKILIEKQVKIYFSARDSSEYITMKEL